MSPDTKVSLTIEDIAFGGEGVARLNGFVVFVPFANPNQHTGFVRVLWDSLDMADALHPQTLLAYGMNGALLYPDHGAPLRVYSAVKLGYKMVKYLTEVNFLPERTGGYWEDQGYEWFGGI